MVAALSVVHISYQVGSEVVTEHGLYMSLRLKWPSSAKCCEKFSICVHSDCCTNYRQGPFIPACSMITSFLLRENSGLAWLICLADYSWKESLLRALMNFNDNTSLFPFAEILTSIKVVQISSKRLADTRNYHCLCHWKLQYAGFFQYSVVDTIS